jgi:diguanylate cyclase (GGDEF)-like protein/PAS domain S-box-containing protein
MNAPDQREADRKRTADRSRRSVEQRSNGAQNQRYKILFEQSAVASVVIEPGGRVVEANRAAARLLGHSCDWFPGQEMEQLVFPQAQPALPWTTDDSAAAEGALRATARREDGGHIPVRLQFASIGLLGTPRTLVCLFDISEQVRAEKIRTAMHRIAEAVNEAEDLDTLYPTIRRILGSVIDVTNFRIALYDPQQERITMPYIVDEHDAYTSFAAGKTATGHVIRSGAPLLLTAANRSRLVQELGLEPIGQPAAAWLGVPLRIEKTVIGALIVQSYCDPDRFSSGQSDVLEQVCDQVALAIQRKQSEEARRDSERRYRSIFESTSDAVLIFDLENRVVEANPNAARLYGYRKDELLGLSADALIHPDSFGGFTEVRDRIKRQGHFVADSINRRKDGSSFDVQVHVTEFAFEGRPHLLSVVRDVSERVRVERALWETSQKIERLHDVARELEACEIESDICRVTVRASEEILDFAFCSLDLVEGDQLVVNATSSGLPPGASQSTPLAEGGIATKTYTTRRTIAFGSLADVPEARPNRSGFASGISAPIGEFGVFQVVSNVEDAFGQQDVHLLELLLGHTAEAIKRTRLERDLRQQAISDPLTGAYNRRHFSFVIEREKRRAERYGHAIGFLMIDVNRFKEINDRFGHQIGDAVLQAAAELLNDATRETDLVVRYGGDEFLVVLLETNGQTGLVKSRIHAAVAKRNETNELIPFPVTFAIGESYWTPTDDRSILEALAEADRRMYEDKHRTQD